MSALLLLITFFFPALACSWIGLPSSTLLIGNLPSFILKSCITTYCVPRSPAGVDSGVDSRLPMSLWGCCTETFWFSELGDSRESNSSASRFLVWTTCHWGRPPNHPSEPEPVYYLLISISITWKLEKLTSIDIVVLLTSILALNSSKNRLL